MQQALHCCDAPTQFLAHICVVAAASANLQDFRRKAVVQRGSEEAIGSARRRMKPVACSSGNSGTAPAETHLLCAGQRNGLFGVQKERETEASH